jgi:hypothetical protein
VLDKLGMLNYYESEAAFVQKARPLNAQPYDISSCTVDTNDEQVLRESAQ